jgi:signal transduction histidine kinase
VALLVPAAMTLAVLRFGLYNLDRVINRTFVWLIMTFLVIVTFVAIVTVLRDLVFRLDTSSASLVATGLVAVAFQPARERVQRAVNHLLYGERDEPYRVVARLGELAGRIAEQHDVLPRLTETIARSLQVPYVAIEEDGGPAGTWLVAEAGTPTFAAPEKFDMVAHGEHVGRLIVAPRSAGAHFAAPERRLLSDVALHAAIAVEATRLVRDLRHSRERLVVAREEERRRLRRDLHDGLGPTIAGMAVQVHSARNLLTGPGGVADRLETLAGDLRTCMTEVRRLIDELRPFALDGGLGSALAAECGKFSGPTFEVTLHLPDDLGGLPGPVEVAAYRIFCEALSNVIRHAGASSCTVVVDKQRDLVLEIVDDGVGTDGWATGGVGLSSMRERAEDLGGTFEVRRRDPRGTTLRVCLPLRLDSHRAVGPTAGEPVPGRAP